MTDMKSLVRNLTMRLSSRKSKGWCPVPNCRWVIEEFDGNLDSKRHLHIIHTSRGNKDIGVLDPRLKPEDIQAHKQYLEAEELLEQAIKDAKAQLQAWREETHRQKLIEKGLLFKGD